MSTYTPTRVAVNSAGLTIVTTAYTAGDQAGTEITVTSIGLANGYVMITNILGVDYSARIQAHELRIFEGVTTPATDNSAASWSDADAWKQPTGPISAASITTEANNSTILYAFAPFLAKCDASGHLYLDMVLRAVPTSNFFSAATDLHFVVEGLQVA